MRKATVLTALLGIAALFLAGKADAAGLYVLGDVGFKSIYQQDMNDSFAGDLDPYGNSYDFGWATLPEGGLTVGYRFQGPFSLEGGVDFLGGRADSDDYGDTFTVNPTTTFYFGPVLCLDHYRWFFAQRGVSEIGIHVSYASVAGSVDYGYGSGGADFSGSATGFGIFFRDLNIWQYSGVTLGFEVGYDYQYFSSLTSSDTTGSAAGTDGQKLQNNNGANDYIDNSAGYFKIVFGWSQIPAPRGEGDTVPMEPAPRYYRGGYYRGY